jgi:hypothetical protein
MRGRGKIGDQRAEKEEGTAGSKIGRREGGNREE